MADENAIVPAEKNQRQPLGEVMAEYVSSDIKNIAYDVGINTVLPGLLDVAHQGIISFFDSILHPYGNNIRYKNYAVNSSPRYNRAETYHGSYARQNGSSKQQPDTREQQKLDRIEAVHNYVFGTYEKAYETLYEMRDQIDKTGSVTVAEFYDIGTDQNPVSSDWGWGWKDLSDKTGTRIVTVHVNGDKKYMIRLPKAVALT